MKKRKQTMLVLLSFLLLFLHTVPADAGAKPQVSDCKAMLLTDLGADTVLYETAAHTRLPFASIAKIMTYIVAAEYYADPVNTTVSVPRSAVAEFRYSDASTAGFEWHTGERFRVIDVLYGLMLPSGCDAAQLLAYDVGRGNYEVFSKKMNQKARALGCTDTYFAEGTGLSDRNYSTCADIVKITKYALTLPYFRSIVKTRAYRIPGFSNDIHNTNYLLDPAQPYYYRYTVGVKTGFTNAAGKCLVSLAVKDGRELLCVALGGRYDSRDGYLNHAMLDSVTLLKWGFETDSRPFTLMRQLETLFRRMQTLFALVRRVLPAAA